MDNPILNNDELSEVEGVEGILDINRRKQIELGKIEDARVKAQKDFDFYARDAGGEPLEMGRVEEYKSKVEPWRFEQSLYGLQEDHFNSSTPEQVNANRRFTPILDKYLLDNPEAYQNLDKHTNREEHIARTLREDSHHYPMFSGEKQGEFTDLKTSEYERLAVANYFSETSEVGFDSVMKNMDLLASSYAQANGLETPDVSSVFNHIKGNLSQRKTERENDKSNWQNGISSVLNGKSLNEALAGSVDDKNGRVTSASRSAFMNEYGGELSKATELYERFSQEAGRTERAKSKLKFDIMPMKMMGGVVSAFTDVPKHQKDAVEQLAIMPREQRQRTLALMYMMAEDNAGELDAGFFGKTGESFARGLDAYIANVGDALELNPEGMVRDADYNRSKRELRQDLGSIKQTVSEIKSDYKFVQGVYDSAGSLTYQLASALPKGVGLTLNTLSMSTDNDIKLRSLYPDMDHSKRWQIALGAGTVQSAIERLSFRGAFKSFPSVSRYMSGKGIAGKLGMVGLRGAGILAIENLEEAAQSATLPIMQSIWGAFADDIPDVSAEDWEESMFLYDERTFFATLPLAVLGAGGKSALDMIGAKASSDMLSDVDRVMVHGFNRDQAEAIANEPDFLKKYFMFKEGSDAKTVEERKSLSDEAVSGGALNRIADKEEAEAWQAYEDNVNEKGSEDEKTALEVEKLARDYSKRYDAQITQDGDQYKITYPENKPSQNFDNKEEADAAMVAHKVEINEGYLDALSSASANVQAMLEHKKTLESKHKGAKVKLGKSIVGLKEFAEKSDKSMAQALERIEHELIKTGEVRPATRADLDKWHTRGEVRLRKKARGYVARLAEGANIADLVEEGSEGFLRDIIKGGLIDSNWVKEQIINYQNETGNKLTSSDNVDGMSDQQMIEAFSDLAVGNFYNAHQQDQTGSLGSIINALRIFFAKVATVAEDLLKLQTEGKIDADFQTLLDNSVGLDMDEQIDRQADEAQKEMLGGETLSIAPEMSEEEKQVGEGADTEAGTPAPDSPTETILPDDSKPQIDWTDPSYSVSPKYLPEVFPLMTEEIARKVLSETDTTSAIHIDRMRVGEFEGVSLQGGMFYPSILENLKERVAWAFNSVGVARTVVDRAAQHGGYVKLVLMTEGNVVGNKTFANIWLNRMDNILDTDEKKAEFMAEFQKVRLSAIKSIVNKKRNAEKKAAVAAKKKGEKPVDPVDEMTLATYHRDGESVTSYDQVRKFMLDMGQSDRGSHYLTRSTRSADTKDGKNKKGDTMYGKLLGVQLSNKRGYPNASEIVEAIEEPAFKGMKKGDVVGLIKLDAIEKGSPIQTAKEVGVTEHLSYGYVVKGQPVAKMKDIHNIEEMYPSIAGQMMSQQNKSYDAKEHITFSITPAQDADYLAAVEAGDTTKQQAMVDERARSMGYNALMKLYHGTKKLFDRFNSDRDPNKLIYFSKDRKMAETYPRGYGGHRNPEADVQKRLDDARQESREYVEGALEELGAKYGENDIPQNLVDDVFEKEKAIQRDALDGMTLARAQSEMGIRVIEGYVRADKIFEPANWREFAAEIMESIGVKSESEIDPQMMRMIEEGNYIVWENSKVVDAVLSKYDAMTIQESSGKEANTIAFRDPSQIKSADPVTYDSDGNVIPLSQRFDAGRDEISMSLAPAEDIVMDRITALMRDPDSKLDVYKNMATRLRKVRERIYSKRIAYGKITPESMSEADKEMDEREFIISSVAQIEAIERVLPPEVRRSLGTKKRASEYKTSKGFARYVSKRLDSVDTALEKYLRRELRASVSKLVKKSQPMSKSKASDSGQSKIGDVGHRVAEAALKAMKMTPEKAARAAQDERETLAEIEDPTIEKMQEHEDVAYIYEMFADFANADSNRLTMMRGLMKTNWDKGRKQWLDVLAKRREWKDNKVKAVVTSLKKMGKSITEKNNAGGMSSKIANAAREQLSFYNITDLLREDMKGAGAAVVGEMTDDLRRANNSFEWAQLQHKEEMKQVFSDIFGIKGTNKTARVQARLNSLAKAVDWGSRVTVVDRFNPDNRISVGNMSQLDLLKDWLAVQQLDLKDKYDTAGHDEQYRTQLDDVLDDDVKELGMWMQNKLRDMTPDTEKLHRSEYGLAMATVENYFPAVFEHRGKEETSLQIDGIDVAGVSKRPSAHKMRVNHNSDPKRQNAAHTFNHHIMQDAFWKSHAEVLRKWAGVLRNAEVQMAIKASKGAGFIAHLNKRLDDIETQGSAVAQIQLESDLFARSLGKGMSLGILGMKLSTIWKNFSALTNVALGVEARELISGLRPEVFREAKDLLKTETFQRRLKMGASVATRYALEGGTRGNVLFTTSERLAEVGVQGINLADTGSNMTMAIAYVARLRKLRSEGVVDAEARAQALDHVDDLMARYAQPTDRLSKSMFENRRMPLVTFLVMFQSEARKQMAINSLAVRKLLFGKGVQSRSLAAQQLLVQVVGVNLMIHVVSSLYAALFKGYGEGDDAEERFINDMKDGTKLASMMLSESFSGIPIAGELISGTVKRLMGQDVFSSSSNPLTRTFGTGTLQMLSTTAKWDERSASENADALLRGLQMLGSVAPQTAFLSQASNASRDALGFMNNTLSQGFSKADTLDIYEKRIKNVVRSVHAETKDEMKDAKDNKDKRMIRSIDTQRKEEIMGRSREIMLEMGDEMRGEFIKMQKESEKGLEKYIIKQLLVDF